MLERALIRLGRVVVAGAVAGGIAAGVNAINGGTLDGTSLASFVVIITSALTAVDKYVRDRIAPTPVNPVEPAPTEPPSVTPPSAGA